MRKIISILTLSLLVFTVPMSLMATDTTGVQILVADNPDYCLSLESLSVTDDGYMLVDGRNNRARVKFIDDAGNMVRTGVSTIPLPRAASLPADILPSPWGLDRIAVGGDGIWAVPASWSGAIAEKFDLQTGDFIERIPDPGFRVSGMVTGPNGDVWAVGQRMLVNVSSGEMQSFNLSNNIFHIDSAVGHPLGFLIYQQPELLLLDSNGIIRWRLNLDGVLDWFISPLDIAAGPDGSIAIGAVLCDLSVQEDFDEYFTIREGCFNHDDEETLFVLEDTLRDKLSVGFALLMIDPEGTITAVKEMGTPPMSVAVDSIGRYHVLSQEDDGWGIYIWDPRLGEEIEVMHIPMGTPSIIAPHRLAYGRDGSLYWDDVYSETEMDYWGIARLLPTTQSGLFTLGAEKEAEIEWVLREPMLDFIRRITSLAVTDSGDIWFGITEFPFFIPEETPDAQSGENSDEALPYTTHLRRYDRSGNLMLDYNTDDLTQTDCFMTDLLVESGGIYAALGATDTELPFGKVNVSGRWEPSPHFTNNGLIAHARMGRLPGKIISWMLAGDNYSLEPQWFMMNEDLSGVEENEFLEMLGCRLLATDDVNGKIYVTIDDGEIFQLDGTDLFMEGLWTNRMPSGAPGHSLDDAVLTADGLTVLDREHRALLLLEPEIFTEPQLSTGNDVDNAIGLIRVALSGFKTMYGQFPSWSPSLLDDILSYNDLEKIKRAFIGGRIYNYSFTEVGYDFVVWSAAADQPVVYCTESDTFEYF